MKLNARGRLGHQARTFPSLDADVRVPRTQTFPFRNADVCTVSTRTSAFGVRKRLRSESSAAIRPNLQERKTRRPDKSI
jgi:hypothetical protein